MTCNYTYKEKLMCRKRWPSLESCFIASKGVDLPSDIWASRKTLKGSLKNIHLMLDLYIIIVTPLVLLYIK